MVFGREQSLLPFSQNFLTASLEIHGSSANQKLRFPLHRLVSWHCCGLSVQSISFGRRQLLPFEQWRRCVIILSGTAVIISLGSIFVSLFK